MKIDEYLNTSVLGCRVIEGFVREQRHPVLPLAILNYTNKTQIQGAWDDVTRKCRGLIYNVDTGEIVARPFEKFFNHNQPEAPSWALWDQQDIRVQDKMDGSLGILFPNPLCSPTGLAVATRGSFTSEQAEHATLLLNRKYPSFIPFAGLTYLFEIVYPTNRIVVDYGDQDDLVLLDILETESGESVLHEFDVPFPKAEQFTVNDVMRDRPGAEGYVITNVVTGERVKVKFEEYKRLHKLLTGVSSKTVWELLAKGQSVDSLLDTVPDEFYDFVNKTAADLYAQHDRIFVTVWKSYQSAYKMFGQHRRAFAEYVKDSEFKDLYFGLLDDKDISPMIWKRLKPSFAKPFWNVDEDNS